MRDFNPAHVGFGSNSTELAHARISFLSVSYRIVGSAIRAYPPQLMITGAKALRRLLRR